MARRSTLAFRLVHIGLGSSLAGILGVMCINGGCANGVPVTSECPPGEVMLGGQCRRVCSKDVQCQPGSVCDPKSAVCRPDPAKAPLPCDPNGDECHENGQCVDSGQGYACACLAGFQGDGREDCGDIDECAEGIGHCEDGDECVNTEGSYECGCQSGGSCGPPGCDDGIRNGDETDTDCGGSCTGCQAGFHCIIADDCLSHECAAANCQSPECADGSKNGDETDIDCGGPCPDCADRAHCSEDGDCLSGVCTAGTCRKPACSDTVKNGDETGTDCGGSCPGCADGAACTEAGDCLSGVCTAGTCKKPSCSDKVKNGDEIGTDCGGSCSGCADGAVCSGDGDCRSGVCNAGTCQSPTCTDGTRNGKETGVDCGGDCTACNPFEVGQNWNGTYTCNQGSTNLRLEITKVSGGDVTAIFHFQYSKTGSYYVSGKYTHATRRLVMTPGAWIVRPDGVDPVGMDGTVNAAGTQYSGTITHSGCGAFSVQR